LSFVLLTKFFNLLLRCHFTTTTHTKNLKFLQIWILSVFLCLSVFLSASPKHVFIQDILYFCLSISVFVSLSFSPSVILVLAIYLQLYLCARKWLSVHSSLCVSTIYLSSCLSVSWCLFLSLPSICLSFYLYLDYLNSDCDSNKNYYLPWEW
jgi:hypothetical protein